MRELLRTRDEQPSCFHSKMEGRGVLILVKMPYGQWMSLSSGAREEASATECVSSY